MAYIVQLHNAIYSQTAVQYLRRISRIIDRVSVNWKADPPESSSSHNTSPQNHNVILIEYSLAQG